MVSLLDWWLVQGQGKEGIAVEGFACRELGARLFRSAPILNRHDSTTLETTDGITITVGGMINRSRTIQSGFPISVCNRFLLGFPHDWENVTAELDASEKGGAPNLMPASFDDLSVRELSNIVMSIPEGSECHFWDMMVKNCKDDEEVVKHVRSSKNSKASNREASKGEEERDEANSDMELDGFVTPHRGGVGVVTRSMRRRSEQQAENVIASAVTTPMKKHSREKKHRTKDSRHY
ncbi:Protein EMBRYO DEFECTIVE 1674 [Linum perenne]